MKQNNKEFENSKAYFDGLHKFYKTRDKAWGIFFPFESAAWLIGGAVDLFLIGAAGYEAQTFSEFFGIVRDSLPFLGQLLVPAVAITASRIGTNAIMKSSILNKQKRWYADNVCDKKKIDYVATRYKDGMDKIISLSKSKDMTQILAIAQQMKKLEKEANLNAKEEAAVEEKLAQHTQNIMQQLPESERKKIAKLFLSLER